MDIVDRIFELLKKSDLSQQELARKIGLKKNSISQWKSRSSKSYNKYLPQIADALGTTVQWLSTGEGPKIKAPITEAEKSSKAATPEGSGLTDEFARIFAQLTPENQNRIIAEMLKRQRNQ